MAPYHVSTDTRATLTVGDDNQLVIDFSSGSPQRIIHLDYIYGVTSMVSNANRAFTIHYLKVVRPDASDRESRTKTITDFRSAGLSEWTRHTLTFRLLSESNPSFCAQLQARAVPTPPERIHAFINPAAGSRQAATHWHETVEPMLRAAGYPAVEVIETKPGGKAREQAETLGRRWSSGEDDLSVGDVIILGGDGTVHQIVNGLSDAFDRGAPAIRLGIIPSGSGNAFSLSLQAENVLQATLKIIKRQTQPFRLVNVVLPDEVKHEDKGKKLRILVVMSWGFHAQLVSKARYLQWFMGNERFSWVALWLLTFLRYHAGELTLCQNIQRYDRSSKQFRQHDDEVVIKDDRFTYFLAAKQPSLERGFPIVPFASPATDDIDVIIMRNVTKEQLKATTVKVIQGGLHVDEPCVEYYKTAGLVLRVHEQAEICLDGEIYTLPAGGTLRLELIRPAEGEPSFETFV
ncbi:ATP-NAD kinase-like domain-containing protein [Dichotomocladium elegans]|nr:ATP-NAD kinase-like domain-containing protein [Dichotomocladium elegans]